MSSIHLRELAAANQIAYNQMELGFFHASDEPGPSRWRCLGLSSRGPVPMSTFEGLSFSPEKFSGRVRLFPLPNFVLFPHVMQPLHVFESRYRDLLEDALRDDRLIAMAVLAPGWQSDYEGRPPLRPFACLTKVATHHRLDDGTYNVLVLGLHRVRLVRELEPLRSYREAEVELCEENDPPEKSAARRVLRGQLRNAFIRVLPLLPDVREQIDQLLGSDVSLGVLTDVLGYMLQIDLDAKAALLSESDVHRRGKMLLVHLASIARQSAETGTIRFPPQFSAN